MMNDLLQTALDVSHARLVPAGEDRLGMIKHIRGNSIVYKVCSQESRDLFAIEVIVPQKGGPPKHIHHDQDEWWYILEGEFIVEVGDERFHLKPGDSLFGPRKIPHTWAFIAGARGRFLGSLMPAGRAEAFFIDADKDKSLLDLSTDLRPTYGVEWVGPPLRIDRE